MSLRAEFLSSAAHVIVTQIGNGLFVRLVEDCSDALKDHLVKDFLTTWDRLAKRNPMFQNDYNMSARL